MQSFLSVWTEGYRTDRLAFYLEFISFVFTVVASLTLAINANAPNMMVVYPAFFVGAVTQCVASYRRGAAWVMLLTFYFSIINTFGFGRAIGWW